LTLVSSSVVYSSVNPIIYAYSSREFRRAFIKYLCRCFPNRVRTMMMSYHNLHLLRYRRAPESNVSKENVDFGSDNQNHNNNNNNNSNHHHHQPHSSKAAMLTSSSSPSPANALSAKHNKSQSSKPAKRARSKQPTACSPMWPLSDCCRSEPGGPQEPIDQRSSSAMSSKAAAAANNILVDYCTYHDVAVSRVTCL
jgi:hypothetical protein